MITEREHWLSITNDPEWRRNHIADPNISEVDTLAAITQAFPPHPERILEIGCGYGRLASRIAAQFPDAMVTGVDINPAVIAEGLPLVAYVCRDNLHGLPLQDVIYSVAVFQHLTDTQKRDYIDQSYDCLRDGGVLRVQFIEGERDLHLDHWVALDRMVEWFADAGFATTSVTRQVHPQWTWITGIK